MLANNLSPSTIHITKEMYSDYKAARVKYEIFLEEERNKKEKSQNNNQKVIIGEEINSIKLITEKEKTHKFLETESFQAMKDAEAKNDMSYVKKANALKRSRDETEDEVKTLRKTLLSLEEKRAKL